MSDDFITLPRSLVEEAQVAALFAATIQPHWISVWSALESYMKLPPTPNPNPTTEDPKP